MENFKKLIKKALTPDYLKEDKTHDFKGGSNNPYYDSLEDKAKRYFLGLVQKGEIDLLPDNPTGEYLRILTKDLVDSEIDQMGYQDLDDLAIKGFNESVNEEEGVPHYTKDGKEWTGPMHKMPDGTLMTQDPHNKDSEELFHKEDLDEEMDGKEDYKYKKYVSKAFGDINDAMFNFRNAMGVKQLGQADKELKDKLDGLHQAIFDLQKEMERDGLTEDNLDEELETPNELADESKQDTSASGAYESQEYKNGGHDCGTSHPDQSHDEWLDQMTLDQIEHDEETLRREIGEESVNEGYDLSNNEIAVLERLIMMIRKGDNLSTNQNIQKVAIPLLRKIMSGYERTDSVSSKFSEPLGEESINEGSDYDAYALKMYGKKWGDLGRDDQSEVVDAVEGNFTLDQIRPVNEGFVEGELEKRNDVLYGVLVPGSGKTNTVEGEMLRAINRIVYRWWNDGDKFYEGYGAETAGPAHSFLVNSNNPLNNTLASIFDKAVTSSNQGDGVYERTVELALTEILNYIESKEGNYTKSGEDMFDYESEYESEEYSDEFDDDDTYDDDYDYDEDEDSIYEELNFGLTLEELNKFKSHSKSEFLEYKTKPTQPNRFNIRVSSEDRKIAESILKKII